MCRCSAEGKDGLVVSMKSNEESVPPVIRQVGPGIWTVRGGRPEMHSPTRLRDLPPRRRDLRKLGEAELPFNPAQVVVRRSARGCQVVLPVQPGEQFYGLGLQLRSFSQRGRKKTLRVNSDPTADLGDSHAPVPFYVSTAGYGVFIDTFRYASFYLGNAHPRRTRDASGQPVSAGAAVDSAESLYAAKAGEESGPVVVDIPTARGVTVWLFAGPDLGRAVQRYVLFSGGGCLPPLWGLGVCYRCHQHADQDGVLGMARSLRERGLPCDVLGLEPGWQSQSYSCSFEWSDRFPQPAAMITELANQGYRVNLWTHAFVHPSSPLYQPLRPWSGDFEVWRGLVPDLSRPEARALLARHHTERHLLAGVSGYKLDECDNSDFIPSAWSFPECSRFPSGMDGEQMHGALGLLYQSTIHAAFRARGQRTCGDVRNSHALAAPQPFTLYSDLYEFPDFLRGTVNAGFSGLLWSPEVRHAANPEDLVRRLQLAVMAPRTTINAWYIPHPPWQQWNRKLNNEGVRAEGWEAVEASCRQVLELRMRLLPYLYAAFARYQREGRPPFRALVMDYPADPACWTVEDAYMMGEHLLVAPRSPGQAKRSVYLPPGTWYDFWTRESVAGGQVVRVAKPLEEFPLFVKADTLLPLADPVLHTDPATCFDLRVQVFGEPSAPVELWEDDGVSLDYEQGRGTRVILTWTKGRGTVRRQGRYDGPPRYRVVAWDHPLSR